MNTVEKLLARNAGQAQVAVGDIVEVDVATSVLLDINFLPGVWPNIRRLADPDKVVVVFDHFVPAPDVQKAGAHSVARAFVERFGIERFHDVGPSQGISHQLVSDYRYVRPGDVLVCADSHTCAGGAFNALARGLGMVDVIAACCTGRTWFICYPTVRYELAGAMPPGTYPKDVFFSLAGRYGMHTQRNIEFHGAGLERWSVDERRALATMCAEVGAEFAVFPCDAVLRDFLAEGGVHDVAAVEPDGDAHYDAVRTIDLDGVSPMVALPDGVADNTVDVSELGPTERIHQAFIGSCANGTLDDIRAAATVLAGRSVADGVRLIVTPSSERVHRQAIKAGYASTLLEAGAIFTASSCGACAGGHSGVVGPGETVITSTTRNFKGRMGSPDARIYLGSSATVAASATRGVICDPRELL